MLTKDVKKTLCLIAVGISSQFVWAQGGPVMLQCKDDIAKFCPEKSHAVREVRTCLEGKKEEVSPDCKLALESTGPGKGKGPGQRNKQKTANP